MTLWPLGSVTALPVRIYAILFPDGLLTFETGKESDDSAEMVHVGDLTESDDPGIESSGNVSRFALRVPFLTTSMSR